MTISVDAAFTASLELRRQGVQRRDDLARVLWPMILSNISSAGSRLLNAEGRPYLWDAVDRRVYEITPHSEVFKAFLYARWGLIATEGFVRHLVTLVGGHAISRGETAAAQRFTHWHAEQQALYISRYDGTSWRLDGSSDIRQVPNGEGALFFDDDGGKPVEVDAAQIRPNGVLLDTLVNDLVFPRTTAGGQDPQGQRKLLAIWLHVIALGGLLPTKPVVIADGAAGSGKTASLQRIQYAIHGVHKAQTLGKNDEGDFGVTLMRSPIALLDNVDRYVEWLQDALCAYVTGAGWVRRKKYSDTDEVTIQPKAFLAFATKNPVTFRRDDIADRSLVFRMERREGFTPLSDLLARVDAIRPLLYGEWLWNLNQIVARVRAGLPEVSSSYRMADFARLALVVGDALGFDRAEVESALEAAQAERDAFLWEMDPLPDLLGKWLDDKANALREASAIDLFAELTALAEKLHVQFYKSPAHMARRLRGGVRGYTIEVAEGGGFKVQRS